MQINCFIMSVECINLRKKSKFMVFFLCFLRKRSNWLKWETKREKPIERDSLLAIQIVYPHEKMNKKFEFICFFFAAKVISFCKSPANRI